ncbi:MAG TPA: glycosyltransferase family 4 protein [Gammaproteobacteria bacterium]|nr:glycosyltransferase family 4 protein [Gammaproteobacteria bacterium]
MSWGNFCLLLFGLSWALTGIYRSHALSKGYVDEPNARSAHFVITARGGGIVFASLWFVLLAVSGYMNWIHPKFLCIFGPAFFVALVGFKDDRKSASMWLRLAVQMLATVASFYFLQLDPFQLITHFSLSESINLALLMLGVLWMTNLMNFMDGSDGLAATEAIMVLAAGGVLMSWAHGYSLTILLFGLVSLVAGFLTWNMPKAAIFMGDSGSGFLGYVIAVFALVTYKWYKIPFEIWVILTGAFWFDASITLIRRVLAGDKWTQPHCLHAYQRLIHGGWSHSAVLFGLICVNVVLISMAIWAFKEPRFLHMILGMSVCFLTVIYIMVEIYKPMYKTWHNAPSKNMKKVTT